MAYIAPYARFPNRTVYAFLIVFLAVISSLIVLLTFFPGSTYIVLVIPLLVQLGILVMVLSQSVDLAGEGHDVTRLQQLGKKLRSVVLIAGIITGFSLSLFNWGTLPSTIAFVATTAFTILVILKDRLKSARIDQVKNQGYAFSDSQWRIEVNQAKDQKRFYLTWKGEKAGLSESEIPLLFEFGELNRAGRMQNLFSMLRRIHALRIGFEKGDWTITPSGQPSIYLMYQADLAELVTISKRDATWLIRSTMNKPEKLLSKIQKIATRLDTYRHVTRHLDNVTYAGNHAIISTSNGDIYVDLHDTKVYRDDEWGGADSGFVCIVPSQEYSVGDWNPIVQYGRGKESDLLLAWQDAIILSKIFNIARETFPVRDLLK